LRLEEKQGKTQLAVQIKLNRRALASLAAGFDVKLPPQTDGKLTTAVSVFLPVNTITDARTHTAVGTMRLDEFTLAGVALRQLTADVRYGESTVRLEKLRGSVPSGGELAGTASLRLIDALPFHVHLEPSGVDLAILDQLDP